MTRAPLLLAAMVFGFAGSLAAGMTFADRKHVDWVFRFAVLALLMAIWFSLPAQAAGPNFGSGTRSATGTLSVSGQLVPMAYVDLSSPEGGNLIACADEIRSAFDGPTDFEDAKTMLALGGIQYEH